MNKNALSYVYLTNTQTKENDEFVAKIGLVEYGESGYYPTDYGYQTKDWVSMMNNRLGFSDAEALAMETCSMFNCWDNFDKFVETYSNKFENKEKI